MSEDVTDLWDGLNLGSLLNDLQRENDALVKAKKMKDPFYHHNKVVESPAYSVIMQRYNCQPAKPKILAKKTLERLADPVKGRHESPVKSRDVERRQRRLDKPPPRRSKVKPAKAKKRSEKMHSPIRQKGSPEDRHSPITTPRKESIIPQGRQEEADSFFLTGLDQEDELPHMDVRINIQGTPMKKSQEVYSPTGIYSARTKEHLHQALQRGSMEAHQEELLRKALSTPPPKPTKNFADQCAERRADISAKKSTAKTNTGKTVRKKKSKKVDTHTSSRSTKVKPRVVANGTRSKLKGEPTVSASGTTSRYLPRKGVTGRRSGVGATGLKPSRKVDRDGLGGLQRVDRAAQITDCGNLNNSESKYRTVSGIPNKGNSNSVKSSNLMGSRSAPNFTKVSRALKPHIEEGEDNLPYRLQPLAGTQRLLGRGAGSNMISKYYTGRLQRAGVRLKPVIPTDSTGIVSGRHNENRSAAVQISEIKSGKSKRTGHARSAAGHHQHVNTNKAAELDPNDDHMASLFAAHAKKLSSSLDKATSLSSQYKRLKEFDGLTAANRSYDTDDPKLSISDVSTEHKSSIDIKREQSPPKKLSIVI